MTSVFTDENPIPQCEILCGIQLKNANSALNRDFYCID